MPAVLAEGLITPVVLLILNPETLGKVPQVEPVIVGLADVTDLQNEALEYDIVAKGQVQETTTFPSPPDLELPPPSPLPPPPAPGYPPAVASGVPSADPPCPPVAVPFPPAVAVEVDEPPFEPSLPTAFV